MNPPFSALKKNEESSATHGQNKTKKQKDALQIQDENWKDLPQSMTVGLPSKNFVHCTFGTCEPCKKKDIGEALFLEELSKNKIRLTKLQE